MQRNYKKRKARIKSNKNKHAWKQRKLGEIAEKVTKKNSNLEISETFTNSAEQGIISQKDFFDHKVASSENIGNYYVVDKNDFVYNPRISTSAPVGPINRNRLDRAGVMSPLYTVFKAKDIDQLFLEWYFKSSCWHLFMYFNGDSGARSDRFSIKDSVFFSMPILVPSKEEQFKIGKIFDQLNETITLQQRKLNSLQKLKKGLLQKMFPKNGENIPEIRFPEFSDAWKQRKFGDSFDFLQNNTLSRAALNDTSGCAMNVHYGDILVKFGESISAKTGELPFICDKEILKKLSNSILKNGDVIIADTAEDMTTGKSCEISDIDESMPVLAGLHTIPVRPKQKFGKYYLGYYLNSETFSTFHG